MGLISWRKEVPRFPGRPIKDPSSATRLLAQPPPQHCQTLGHWDSSGEAVHMGFGFLT